MEEVQRDREIELLPPEKFTVFIQKYLLNEYSTMKHFGVYNKICRKVLVNYSIKIEAQKQTKKKITRELITLLLSNLFASLDPKIWSC